MEFVERVCEVIVWVGLVIGALWLLGFALRPLFGTPESWRSTIQWIVIIGGVLWCFDRARRFWQLVIEADPDGQTVRVQCTGPWLLGMPRSGKDRVPLQGVKFDADDLSWWQRPRWFKVKNVTIGDVSIRNISEDDYARLQAIHAYVNATDRRMDKSMVTLVALVNELKIQNAAQHHELMSKVNLLGRTQLESNQLLADQNDLLRQFLFRQSDYSSRPPQVGGSMERTVAIGTNQVVSQPTPTDPK